MILENGGNPNFIYEGADFKNIYWVKSSVTSNTNIHRAIEKENVEIVKLLLFYAADISIKSKFNSLPIHTG